MVLSLLFGTEIENNAGLSLLYTLRGSRTPPPKVVIVTLDSVSARALNLPERPDRWPRSLHARLLDGLRQSGARAVGFDLLFEMPRVAADDQLLAQALKSAGNVVLAAAVERQPVKDAYGRELAQTDHLIQPFALFYEAAWASAPFVMPKTSDGVLEFWSTIPMIGDMPSLPLLMAQRMGVQPAQAESTERRLLNLYGPLATIQTIHYSDALKIVADRFKGPALFGGKAVFIGYSESNQSRQIDAFRSAFSTAEGIDVSGVELCATALANLLDQSELRRLESNETLALLALWAVLLVLPWLVLRAGPAMFTTFVLWLAYGGVAVWQFSDVYFWLPVIQPLGLTPALTVTAGLFIHQRQARSRQWELEQALDLGLTRAGMEKLAAILPNRAEGATLFAVCLCSDIVAYTRFSESLAPEAARDALNRYFGNFIPIVERHGGYVMDIVGDSAMCVWIADESPGAACRLAQAAALELHRCMNLEPRQGTMRTRFGLHFGPIFVGPVGGYRHSEFRAVGDIVNTSSRIQAANKTLGCQILASAEVVSHAGENPCRRLGRFAMLGKSRTVDLYELLPQALPLEVIREFEAGRTAFFDGQIRDAEKHFLAARARNPMDGPCQFFLGLCSNNIERFTLIDGAIELSTK